MLEQELKSKIANTVNQYKLKCHQLEDEINVLKSAIYQLSLLPHGIHVSLDKQIHNLRTNLKENKDSKKIKKSVELLVNAMSNLKEKKQLTQANLTDFIKQETDLLSRIAITEQEKKAFRQAAQSIKKEDDEHLLIEKFNKLLEDAINWVTKQLTNYQQVSLQLGKVAELHKPSQPFIDFQINSRLNQLLEHILIPEDLANKLQALKMHLKKQLTTSSLTEVVDALTDLVIEAFNLEHDQFKGFLNRFADYLHDFSKYLDLTNSNNSESQQEADAFEIELQNRIQQIKAYLKEAKTIEELSSKVKNDLEEMEQQIRIYREEEQSRAKEYNEKIMILQNKLEEAECGAERIRNHLSFHKVRINHDLLTGLPNETAYKEYILGAFHRWQRGFGELSLVLADIDHLKEINNQYGHSIGDSALKKVATVLKSSIRAADFIARYGGGEFVLIFERTSVYHGTIVLENLRTAIEECELNYHGTKINLTLSFGLTALKHGDTLETFFARAQEAMHQAKQNGRNQIVTL
ncbi:GGDEF domain-containing protein [Legionella maceachernii]|uniref:diguanylate cyclase n=1 Tax=Legionella maceachernii TaxID=466 RepID=A0A0W0W5I7_9GAMM|nr:GGDEF domain-containing protein [Legionella maceachernii]KTD27158.1 GGDEF domain-containing protein [Legionella maceachernii]SKA13851.1 diguanylate cyclase (GGDEF) domain-containing protein [Legionella maceachernii]SUP04824.1 Stalked cell differentiation-controlling protein [Legionella maceachernii]